VSGITGSGATVVEVAVVLVVAADVEGTVDTAGAAEEVGAPPEFELPQPTTVAAATRGRRNRRIDMAAHCGGGGGADEVGST
jgi:hypothetical protein